MAMKKCSSVMDVGLPPMSIDSLSRMIYRKALMDEPTSQKAITIFYDGQVYVFDLMELQVRAMILLATIETERGTTSRSSKEAVSLALQSQILGYPCGSVTKSLRKFMQNRKKEASDPYNHN